MHALKKNHKCAIIMGCGPSINLLEKRHLPWLNTLDKWASNNFLIHDFIVPDFYNVETKTYAKDFLMKMVQLKKSEYQNTTWMVSGFDQGIVIPNIINSNDFDDIFCYELHFVSNIPNYIPKLGRVTAFRGTSFSILVDMACAMQYETIFFIGVDLYSSEYFWTSKAEYEHLDIPYHLTYNRIVPGHISKEKASEYKKKYMHETMANPHATKDLFLTYMIDVLDSKKKNMINLSPDSLLADIMPTQDIDDKAKDKIRKRK